QGLITCFLFFLIPGFPKDYLCLALGLTKLNWRLFLLVCALGRVPGTLMLSLQGAMVYQENYWSLLWISLIALAFLAPAYIFREKIYEFSLKLNK
ncbi:MAG: VTT domain-containing protein, partial [Desulfarculales bacterium]|nr:VTT domain-containing protein [Desulfarculales bacterium]